MGVVAANGAFVGWWVGQDKYLGLGISALFAINMMLRHLAGAVAMTTFCFGDERRIAQDWVVRPLLQADVHAFLLRLSERVPSRVGKRFAQRLFA